MNDRRADVLEVAAVRVRDETGASVLTVSANVETIEGRNALIAACPDPNILVTNAGGPLKKDFRELAPKDWSRALDANMLSAVVLITHYVDGMIARKLGGSST